MEIRELLQEEWPEQLLEIPQPPEKLWVRGTLPVAGTKLLTVVGSRAMTPYGQEACQKLIAGLAGYPVSIVSGLALGIDTCAHKAALAAGLHTTAIPGSGLADEVIGPRANFGLAKDILAKGGALLSEHEAEHVARPYDFPSRNRLMVGLADAVLVIEAGQKSGTLITARLAADYNRELLCVPHRIGDPHAFGPHLFIRLGATLVTEPLHILEALRIPPRETAARGAAPTDLEDAELAVWQMLEEPKTRDEILRASPSATGAGLPARGMQAGEALTALVALELRGLVREEFGAWHRL
ncbi:MAG: DNA-processing protein DprA [Minisyncoccota bacterium]